MVGDRESFGHDSFQLIRLVLAVLYRHSFDLLATGHADVVLDLIPPRTHLGRIALCFFMVVSGFLVAHSWMQSAGWRDFLWRRVLRVYPGFIVAAVVSAFVAAPLGSADLAAYLASIDVVGFVELLPLIGTYLLLYLAYEPRLVRFQVGRRVDLSYGIYLYAWPVQQLLIQAFEAWLNPYTLSVAALVGSGGLAWLSWTWVERPFLGLKRRAEHCPTPSPECAPSLASAVACQQAPERRSTNRHGDRP